MKDKLIIIMLVVSFVILLGLFYLNSAIVLKEQEIITTLTVGDKAGFDTNSTALTFGMIKEGSNSNRKVIVENGYSYPIKLEFSVEGDIERFLGFEKTVYLDPGENKTLSMHTITARNETFGNYSGKMTVVTKRNLFG